MKSKAGPNSKELKTVNDAIKFLDNSEHSIIGFFDSADSKGNQRFQKLASALTDKFRFAHTFSADVRSHYTQNADNVVIYRPKRLVTKLEPDHLVYNGGEAFDSIKDWVDRSIHGLAGHRTTTNVDQFQTPLIIVYYDVDYVKNPKGTNYWRNRVMKVAKSLADAGKKITFAVSNGNDMSHELGEFGLKFEDDKPVATGRDISDQKFKMEGDFSMETLEKFANDLLDGRLEPYLKSEPIPPPSSEHVKVVVAKQFDEIVNDPTKDVLIEFYAPWCGHCKSLAPKYEELAEKLKDETDIVIAKMDATANDVPKQFDVKGFPTIYFAPKGSKKSPKKYEGAREVADFFKYLAKESTDPLKGYSREGKKVKKDKKTEL
jgi:protein disulfide isomerase family A protein 3